YPLIECFGRTQSQTLFIWLTDDSQSTFQVCGAMFLQKNESIE
ncbi:1544_t:CDS:1, partial [Acaulospora morrowiae]